MSQYERNNAFYRAKNYADVVSGAASNCADAATNLVKSIQEVNNAWRGESGGAMAAALDDLRTELNAIYAELTSLANQMYSRANYIYYNWVEEPNTSEGGGEGAFGGGEGSSMGGRGEDSSTRGSMGGR